MSMDGWFWELAQVFIPFSLLISLWAAACADKGSRIPIFLWLMFLYPVLTILFFIAVAQTRALSILTDDWRVFMLFTGAVIHVLLIVLGCLPLRWLSWTFVFAAFLASTLLKLSR